MPTLPVVPPSQKAVETEPTVHEDAPLCLVEFWCILCRSVEIQHMDFAAEYPWRIHSYGHSPCPWDASANGSFGVPTCLLTTTTAGGACDECVQSGAQERDRDDAPGRANAEGVEEYPDHEWSARLRLLAYCHGGPAHGLEVG